MDIREQQDICIALDLRSVAPLCFAASGSIARSIDRGAIYDTACDLAFFVHLGQLSSFNGNRHLGVYNLNCCQRSNLRTLNTAYACTTSTVFSMICTLSSRVGYVINATSVRNNSCLMLFYFKTAYGTAVCRCADQLPCPECSLRKIWYRSDLSYTCQQRRHVPANCL